MLGGEWIIGGERGYWNGLGSCLVKGIDGMDEVVVGEMEIGDILEVELLWFFGGLDVEGEEKGGVKGSFLVFG